MGILSKSLFSFMHISMCLNFPDIQIGHLILRDDFQNLYSPFMIKISVNIIMKKLYHV